MSARKVIALLVHVEIDPDADATDAAHHLGYALDVDQDDGRGRVGRLDDRGPIVAWSIVEVVEPDAPGGRRLVCSCGAGRKCPIGVAHRRWHR